MGSIFILVRVGLDGVRGRILFCESLRGFCAGACGAIRIRKIERHFAVIKMLFILLFDGEVGGFVNRKNLEGNNFLSLYLGKSRASAQF